jgi:hypothetical protein
MALKQGEGMKTLWLSVCLMGAMSTGLMADGDADAKRYKMKLNNGGTEVRITATSTTSWSLIRDTVTYDCTKNDGTISVTKSGKPLVAGTIAGDKLNLVNADGKEIMNLKFRADKIKLTVAGDKSLWEFKISDSKIKVRVGEKEYGKAKFYKDTGKTKAKNSKGVTVAEVNGLGRNSAAVAVPLIAGLSTDRVSALTLVFLLLGK